MSRWKQKIIDLAFKLQASRYLVWGPLVTMIVTHVAADVFRYDSMAIGEIVALAIFWLTFLVALPIMVAVTIITCVMVWQGYEPDPPMRSPAWAQWLARKVR